MRARLAPIRIHARALQLQDPPNRLPTRLVDTNTPRRDTDSNTELEPSPSLSLSSRPEHRAPLSFVPHLSSAARTRGYARSNAERLHARPSTTHRLFRNRDSDLSSPLLFARCTYGVASRTIAMLFGNLAVFHFREDFGRREILIDQVLR